MSLKTAFQNAAQSVIKAFGAIRESVTYRSWGSTAYASREVTLTMTEKTVKGIWEDFTVEQIDNVNVLAQDRIFIVARKDLIAAGFASTFEPHHNDQIQRGSDERWDVVRIERDPADAHYTLQVRMGEEP